MIRSLFPIHRPRLGLSLRTHGIDLIEVRRRWRRPPTVVRVGSRTLPVGLLTPSATTANMPDLAAVAKEVDALFEGVRDRTVAIDLPMACGTPALLHFDTFPTARTEQEALLRWRLRQEDHLTAPDLTLRWHCVPEGDPSSTAVSVMVVAIRQSILDQYYQVCEEAHLLPVAMGWSTFHLPHLAQSVFPAEASLYVAHRTAELLIVLALQQGQPVHLRVKPIRRTSADVKSEILQTLQYFAQDDPPRNSDRTRVTPLYLVEEGPTGEESWSPEDSTDVWTLSDDPHWSVPVTRARWTMAPIVSMVDTPEPAPLGALAALLAA